MSARDELANLLCREHLYYDTGSHSELSVDDAADAILAAGYSKPRTITTVEELEKLPYGSAVQTADESDTVVLKDKGAMYRNQSGCELSATDLWRFGTRPFIVIYSPGTSK